MANPLRVGVVFAVGLFLNNVERAAGQPAAGFDSDVRVEQVVTFVRPFSTNDLRISALARANAETLVHRSATFRDLLAALRQEPRLRIHLDVGDARGGGGRTDFQITAQRVNAAIFLKASAMTSNPARMRVVAHELAHVYEVICLPFIDSTAALRGALISRGATRKHGELFETEFALQVEEAVYGEWVANAGRSQLRRIATAFGLECPRR
jgi:hypothetical protein